MDNHAYQTESERDPVSFNRSERARLADARDVITYLQTVNKLRDIYIDSSMFRNPVWDTFLTLYAKELSDEEMAIDTLAASARIAADDCRDVVDRLTIAGLVELQDQGEDRQLVLLTDQGRQRMDAFLRSASRGQ
ncbi:hypothetical protein [Parasphingopyxis marina]|uniref:HTH marR-type domain-containing protein n=1 Tax=Parasphingopyxis marina TaxID=2761622 RepID=A0A842I1X9_9SPHN|nr:hypothetical protein [Parasphingopyxis marina]MBC2779185.1 hypothetical protein [Parasphingopyxis marina]